MVGGVVARRHPGCGRTTTVGTVGVAVGGDPHCRGTGRCCGKWCQREDGYRIVGVALKMELGQPMMRMVVVRQPIGAYQLQTAWW